MRNLQSSLLLLPGAFDAFAHIQVRKACDRYSACAVPIEATMPLSVAVVLVVEDSPLILMSALDLIMSAGFEGVGAANADEAIAVLEARADVQLVFTDVEMPGTMDGAKLAHYIRNRWPPIHLMVASGKVNQEESELPTGALFFAKPYDNDMIIMEMTRMLSAIVAHGNGHKT